MATTTNAKIVLTAEDRASRVIGQLKAQLAEADKSATQFASAAGLLGPALAGLAAGAGAVTWFTSITKALDALNDAADATGATIETLSGLERVARLNGGTLDEVSSILVKFNQALNTAGDPNSNAAAVFKSLGLSLKDLTALDPATALQKTALALRGFADDGNKARATQELMGKSIREAAPFLKDLAEAGVLQAGTTKDQAEQAERFNKELARMKTNSEDTARALVGSLLPAINQIFDDKRTGGWAKVLGLPDLENQWAQLKGIFATLDLARQRITPESILAKDPGNEKALAELMRLDAQAEGLRKTLGKAHSALQLVIEDDGESKRREGRGPSRKGLEQRRRDEEKKKEKPYSGLSYSEEVLQSVTRAIEGGDVVQGARLVDQIAALDKLFFDANLRTDVYESAMRKLTGVTLGAKDVTSEFMDEQRRLSDLLGRTATAGLERQRADMALLDKAFQAGAISALQFSEAATAALGLGEKDLKDTTDGLSAMLDQFARNAQDALGDTLEATLRGNFDSIEKLWGNLIIKMVAQAGAAQLGQALLGDFAKSGSIGGIFGDALGAIGFGKPKANGGSVGAMSLQRVNERGFEVFTTGGQDWLMTGGRGGVVTPNSQVALASAAPSVPAVVNHINVATGVTRGEVTAAIQFAMKQTEASVLARLRNQRVTA